MGVRGGAEVRVGFAHAGGVELAGGGGKAGADGLAVCEVTVGEACEVGMVSVEVGGEVTAFHMERG
jgi:hypothetical protein